MEPILYNKNFDNSSIDDYKSILNNKSIPHNKVIKTQNDVLFIIIDNVIWFIDKIHDYINEDEVKLASINNDFGRVKFLLTQGAYITTYDDWIIKFAIKNSNIEILKFLASKGFDVPLNHD